ncbi:helix-turn-helix domain-containing protein [Saccharopolyspora mangrovi]|uniref:Helix-turn-helix domain-containing protein n=1 Tax=Saccharopolyspora mangrovi TaxID=3082379 RepID=A0ABU6ADW9_9PSEU|nr:helix-turn-helix domain-containing protein [Saccharopolyspora sp. S2-29]MEB3369510.1 helix-turn-helix domain-containing protein [Saccharopolyspora sp. S2-29]
MPRPRVHDLDRVLDVAEQLVVDAGPERLTVRKLAAESGVPNGAIYHAFGSLGALRGRMWLRAAVEFLDLQTALIDDALGAAPGPEDARNAVVVAADAPAELAARRPAAARMLMTVRREQLLGPDLPEELADSLLGLDRRLVSDVLCRLAMAMWGRRDGPSIEVITSCVVDLPTALLRRALTQPAPGGAVQVPADLRTRLAAAVRAVLDLEPPRRISSQGTTHTDRKTT